MREQPHAGQLLVRARGSGRRRGCGARRSGRGSPRPAGLGPRSRRGARTSNRKRCVGQRSQRHPVPGQAGRHRAVEQVDARRAIPSTQVVGLADPEQVPRRLGRRACGAVIATHPAHLLLVAAQRAADRQPVDGRRRHALGRRAAQVLVDAALDDPEHGLAARAPGARARRGSGRASGGFAPSSAPCSRGRRGRACTRRRRARCRSRAPPAPPSTPRARGSARTRRRRSGTAPRARRSRATSPARPAPAPALDLVGDAAVGEREDLKAARSR